MGKYTGKGQNKPKGSDVTPDDAWTYQRLVSVGMQLLNTFQDVVFLRQVHRCDKSREDIPACKREVFRNDAARFLSVTRGMGDCTWTRDDHVWLSQRNRSVLQQTEAGREELRKFETAPLLMDGRQDRVTGEIGAKKINLFELEK